jgi:hypothetical protein
MIHGNRTSALPIGSHLDPATGSFAWAPGLAFGGHRDLVFERTTAHGAEQIKVRVTIDAQAAPAAQPQLAIDGPQSGASVTQPFTLGGWAFDPNGSGESAGIDALHVWAYPVADYAQPRWVGTAPFGGLRPDVAAAFGPRFIASGYTMSVAGLPPGMYDLVVYAHSTATGTFAVARTVRVNVMK